MSTLRSISERTGLAVTTVSEILRGKPGYNEDTCKRVHEAARRLNYRPSVAARQLRGGPSGLLGVLIGMDNPQVNFDRLACLERAAFQLGFRLVVGQIHEGDAKVAHYVEDFVSRGMDGILWLHQPFVKKMTIPPALLKQVGTLVSLDKPLAPGAGCVRVDYGAGVAEAVRYLQSKGRRRVALALAGKGQPGDPMRARLAGFQEAVGAEAKDLVWLGEMEEVPRPERIKAAIRQLVKQGRADALIASNDLWATAFLKGLKAAGIAVPTEVAVVGFDNLAWSAWLDPALTTVDQQHERFAQAALGLLDRQIKGPPLAPRERVVVVTPRLILRESA